eukprot:TRINITY_DN45401_c0_g1_i2.p1 TRINITY_DN45401_c0_g1~~TRINITY_DN45401_c0_g1_i2.p1  ORF type:complete len:158 (+),score=7.40 TRINITY_DN45401_c0_g1_i2:189-662(+)
MKKFKEFDIQFVGLKQGKHQFDFEIKQKFFDAFEFEEFNDANVHVDLTLDKKSTMLELTFECEGFVNVYCDLSNEPYDQEIKSKLHLLVKFGDEYNDENEEVLIIPHSEYQINVAQYIYEMLSLIHISEPTRLLSISYAVFCLKKKKIKNKNRISIR